MTMDGGPFQVFLESEAQRINRARLDHLASLNLDLSGKRVLEVGAGIGLHTGFFEERNCDVLSTDGAVANVAEMLRRHPHRKLGLIDLDNPGDLSALGTFDVVYCYGTLYHLNHPEEALAQLAHVCRGMILLETVVLPGRFPECQMISEPLVANQALCGTGCRPTRAWVMDALRRLFGYAYTTLDQPDYPDFIKDWGRVDKDGNLRAVFVGSREVLSNPNISERLPIRHRNAPPRGADRAHRRVWIDVGAHLGEHSRAEAADDPDLVVHAFEPLPTLGETLKRDAPPNFVVHAMAVSGTDGMAPFRINEFDAASSLLPMDEKARSGWTEGHLLREDRIVQVPTTRLDSFLDRLGIDRIEFLKIDAQGADFEVLKSAGERLASIDRIQVEVTVADRQLYVGAADKATIVDFMTDRGFRLHETNVQSHGQEENLTFVRIAAEQAPPAGERPVEEEVRAYVLSAGLPVVGSFTLEGEVAVLETAPEAWAYTVVVPLDRSGLRRDDRLRVTFEAEADAGLLQIGILNDSETDFHRTAMAKPGGRQRIEFVTPSVEKIGPLVVRNGSEYGVSRGRVRLVSTHRVGPSESVVTAQEETLEFEGTDSLADQLAAVAEALQPGLATCGGGEAAKITASARRLAPAFVRQGMALVDLDLSALDRRLSAVEDDVLVKEAVRLSALRPLAPFPGWGFDTILTHPDLLACGRYALWRALKQRRLQRAAELPWHAGTRILTRFDNDLSLAIYVAGCFEPNEFSLLDRVLAPGMTVLDGGANEGTYTLFFAARVSEKGRVVAVEPSSRERERLGANLALNALSNVDVVEAALDERAGTARLHIAGTEHGGQNTLGSFAYESVSEAASSDVATMTIDAIVAEKGLKSLDVLKLDVEGAEMRALRGARETLARFHPLILLEANEQALGNQGATLEDVRAFLTALGYVLFAFDSRSGDVVPSTRSEFSDNLVAIRPGTRAWSILFPERGSETSMPPDARQHGEHVRRVS